MTLKWHTINDSQTYCQYYNNELKCLAIERCRYLLDVFQEHFIELHVNNNQNVIDFVHLYNNTFCINKFNIIDSINDFNHVHKHHINDMYKFDYLIPDCKYDVCIAQKRNDYNL